VIVDFVVTTVFGLLGSLLSLAPTWGVPSYTGASSDGAKLAAGMGYVSNILPVADMLAIIAAGLAVAAAVSLWNVVMFVYNKLPFLAHN